MSACLLLALLLVILLVSPPSEAFFAPRLQRRAPHSSTKVHFKEKGQGEGETRSNPGWLTRFLPAVVRARFEKSFAVPEPDTGNRYHIRLLRVEPKMKRHAVTRLQRFLPGDISWETASEIVETAIREEKSLIRVCTSLREATELQQMLRLADPAVATEVYDSRKDEVLM